MAQFNSKNKADRVARRWFTDLDINMTLHPIKNDLALKYDINAIKRSVRNLLSTNLYERPFKPNLGIDLRGLLFELDNLDNDMLKDEIISLISSFEPRVEIDDLLVSSKGHELNVTMYFSIINTSSPHQLDVILQRTK